MNTSELFGSMVFNDSIMRQKLPKDTYKALRSTIEKSCTLDLNVANIVANAMKDWAIEKGVTHYTHWFQPMTGITAEKHDSFISATSDGHAIMEFSGKELIKGEPDASSFPSGGLRATFEARGYTMWDPTSFAFIKNGVLCIPTAFSSYGGEALDKKAPLLRSMEALNLQAMRIIKLFNRPGVTRVLSTVGPEQEYFLIDKDVADKRKDLLYCGRTLFGAKPPKGQEMEAHYFGTIKPRVSEYMRELDTELWKLGVLAKIEHNETAPAQHELAPIFTTTNIACDHNQLTMEMMKTVAKRHNLTCLLNEKPFAYVNGSGKHNNWSITTNLGQNLLEPGESPEDNAQFLLFLVAIIKAVDEHQDLLRLSVATAGNDYRLGAHEAPPTIVSIFLGDELTDIFEAIEKGVHYDKKTLRQMEIGVDILPRFPKDTTDRNRTSPFAFTGNKFEFRMLGSANSISNTNVILNTIVADVLQKFAIILEAGTDFKRDLQTLIKQNISEHKRIIFNGNNYTDEWVKEAEKRGLLNLRQTPEALSYYTKDENIKLFEQHHVFSPSELHSRYEIKLEMYNNTIQIEAVTMIDIVNRDILPASIRFQKDVTKTAIAKKQLDLSVHTEMQLAQKLSDLTQEMVCDAQKLSQLCENVQTIDDLLQKGYFYAKEILISMQQLRKVVDELETIMPSDLWPMPTYGELLFSV